MRGARVATTVVASSLAAAVAGCGGGKPAYCQDATNLKNSLQSLKNVTSVSALQTGAKNVQSSATALVNSAKGDFPSESAAIKSSVNTLLASFKQVTQGQTAVIAQIPGQATAVANSITSFQNASKSKCK